ncbi:hypothetical protein [Sutterella sp.]|uniref:hypothetical protein n=1 Tax=Sutterella sp. TaxID=1981025 RepID=UPI0026E01836|nr:hypothetical protein [Sutterella sp.]MDO5530868.1 hypothetical protein [Sutterella sp.]
MTSSRRILAAALTAGAVALTGCSSAGLLGGDRDDHGCIPSAGFSWSEVKGACVQPFEAGVRLNPVERTGSAVISAFALVSDDGSRAEVWLPESTGSAVLARSGDIWADQSLRLERRSGKLVLSVDGRAKYAEE